MLDSLPLPILATFVDLLRLRADQLWSPVASGWVAFPLGSIPPAAFSRFGDSSSRRQSVLISYNVEHKRSRTGEQTTADERNPDYHAYAAPVWAKAHRLSALRICSALRTVSTEAALVIAGIPPLDLIAQENKVVFNQTHGKGLSSNAKRSI